MTAWLAQVQVLLLLRLPGPICVGGGGSGGGTGLESASGVPGAEQGVPLLGGVLADGAPVVSQRFGGDWGYGWGWGCELRLLERATRLRRGRSSRSSGMPRAGSMTMPQVCLIPEPHGSLHVEAALVWPTSLRRNMNTLRTPEGCLRASSL